MTTKYIDLDIYLDGSAYRNPGHEGGIAAIACYPDERGNRVIFNEKYSETTNNRMELRAVIKAIEYARTNLEKEKIRGITLWTDSQYVFDNFNRAVYWRSNSGLNRYGRAVENMDLWKKLVSLRQWCRFSISLQWNKGKKTEVLKEVDHLAKKAARSPLLKKDYGYKTSKVSRSKIKDGHAPTMFEAMGQVEVIRIYSYEYRRVKNRNEYKIKFDLYSNKELLGKHFAYMDYTDRKNFHRNHYYEAEFNDTPENPRIIRLVEINDPTT